MTSRRTAVGRDTDGLVWLWAAFFAGPLAWVFNQGVGYAAMKPICAAGAASAVLWLIASAAFCVAGVGAWMAWRSLLRASQVTADDGGTVRDRTHFVAILAFAFNGLIGLLIITATIPQFLLSPCE